MGQDTVSARYGNLFEMYGKITGENPYKSPMRIYPAVHYTMGGMKVNPDAQAQTKDAQTKWEERVQYDALKEGNALNQNDILQKEIGRNQ